DYYCQSYDTSSYWVF
nr:immunoglobulin light chain junction region [Macaca mulatta]MOW02131.1 immunoglobulin light chain junction region [Macaca mulatta]MOW02372.1 immunoglobulin light chain junction region [Macaca mulatta]MOW02450.1 immunoglobulin light chain junction region [Macaca mulatta]MOW02495.1 immunoglobulin light chain junction region [Macaca mulatta]